METGDYAWLALAAGIAAYDATCPKGQMLSERSATYTQRHPLIWPATVIYFAGHLLHVWGRHDPLTKLAKTFGR